VAVAVAAQPAPRIGLATGIAVAFARNPMTLATAANDLQLVTSGRFTLGIGSQVAAHITRRYDMPWSHPAARMREFIAAIRAIWTSWDSGDRLDFRGKYYSNTLMPPFFNPGPNPHGNPQIFLAAVGSHMVRTAGEVADGLLCHTSSTERFLRETTLPALRDGCARAGRSIDRVQVSVAPMIALAGPDGPDPAELAEIRRQIGFYGATPGYRPVLDLHGLGSLADELAGMARHNRWDDMPALIDDSVMQLFAIVGTPETVFTEAAKRYNRLAQRVCLNFTTTNGHQWDQLLCLARKSFEHTARTLDPAHSP
jgi:probable F420-dependent oxidoreductase